MPAGNGRIHRMTVSGVGGPISVLRRETSSRAIPVVLIHGVNGAASQWLDVMALLADRPVLAVDLRGHGESARASGYDADAYAADVTAVLDHVGFPEVHLVGTSFGGGVAVTVAAQRPAQAQSVAIIGGALTVAGTADIDLIVGELRRLGPTAFFELIAASSFAPGTDETLIRDSVALAARRDADTIEHILRDAFTADVSEAAARVTAKALVLTGGHDQTCPPELGAALAHALGARPEILPGRGHMAHVEDPALIAQRIDSHLADVETHESIAGG